MDVSLYDTTLRDGAQSCGISYSLEDKLRVSQILAEFGVPFIEAGWPGSNPKDNEFFQRARDLDLGASQLVAFGCTRHPRRTLKSDPQIQALVSAETQVVTVVGKAWDLHVEQVLSTDLSSNLKLIDETVRYLVDSGRQVVFDAEHFFDGYRANPDYAMRVLGSAVAAGASWLVLCDTNGGSLPSRVCKVVSEVQRVFSTPLGIHAHNDAELAVANSIAAVQSGATMVQGTVNGYGERCGNANLVSLVGTLQLKLGLRCVDPSQLHGLTHLSRTISEIANRPPDPFAAYVGSAAFAHKGGIHVAAIQKTPLSYEHITPDTVGNSRKVLISELSGRANLAQMSHNHPADQTRHLLTEIKQKEYLGYQFEAAEASVELIALRADPQFTEPFRLTQALVYCEQRPDVSEAEAVIKVDLGDRLLHVAASGVGPVHALDCALRKALIQQFPVLSDIRLVDYKVRILDSQNATHAVTRVLIEASDGTQRWSTVGCSANMIEASSEALVDSFVYFLTRISQQNLKGAHHVPQ